MLGIVGIGKNGYSFELVDLLCSDTVTCVKDCRC